MSRPGAPHDLESSPTRRLLGGHLRADDSRRFLVEVMVGAVHADGQVDPREKEAMRRIVEEHDLFAGLAPRVADTMIALAADALWFSGDAELWRRRLAAALPWRLHRLAAYAMACEVIAADDVITDGEEEYLRQLRRALIVGAAESSELLEAARERRALSALDAHTARVHALLPGAARVCVAHRLAARRPIDAGGIAGALGAMLDFAAAPPLETDRVARMAEELAGEPGELCVALAHRIPDPADRTWALVYTLAVDAAAGASAWRDSELLRLLRIAFELSERQMDRCAEHGARLAERSTP